MIDFVVLTLLTGCMTDACGSPSGDLLTLTDSQWQPQTLFFGNPRRPACASVRTVRRDQAESVGKKENLSDLTNLTDLTGVLISAAEALFAELFSCFDPATLAVLRNHSKMRTLPTRVAAR